MHAGKPTPPPVDRMTDKCKNITFQQLRLRAVNIPEPLLCGGAPVWGILYPPLQLAFCGISLRLGHTFLHLSDCSKEFWMLPCTPSENPSYFLPKATTLNDCMLMCHKSTLCKGFDWLPEAQKCWVMKVKPVADPRSKFFNFHAVFGKQFSNNMLERFRLRLTSPLENARSVTENKTKTKVSNYICWSFSKWTYTVASLFVEGLFFGRGWVKRTFGQKVGLFFENRFWVQ